MSWSMVALVLLATSLSLSAVYGWDPWKPHNRSPYIIRNYTTHHCRRDCEGSQPEECQYYFLVEHYQTMTRACKDCPKVTADCYNKHCVTGSGESRDILAVNRMMPGPFIDVCENDTIEVLVDNNMALGEGLSIHWHGLPQKGTPFMDGTNLVTQCPIQSWGKMIYRFKAAEHGTYFWHSHSSLQRADGLFGGLVIRQPKSRDPNGHLYDVDSSDHWIILSDLPRKPIVSVYVENYFDEVRALPADILINGLGSTEDAKHKMPTPVFKVQKGKRYRFRVVLNGILNCPIYMSVDNHTLLMIATDGQDIEPVPVDRFNILSGERYDFVLNANQTEPKNFWIRFKARGRGMEILLIKTAILRYEGAPDEDPKGTVTYRETPITGRVLNGIDPEINMETNVTAIKVSDLKAKVHTKDTELLTAVPDRQFYVSVGVSQILDPRFRQRDDDNVRPINQQLNYISSRLPPYPPLTEFEQIPQDIFCNNMTMAIDCSKEMCECVHILPYKLGDIVEMILVNFKTGPAHPMHMHGHSFTVLGQKFFGHDITVNEIKDLDIRKEILRNRSPDAPTKDTLQVQGQSIAIIRFRADNPGFWFFHCHIEFHAEVGMNLVLMEGERRDMPKPPDGISRCGYWETPEATIKFMSSNITNKAALKEEKKNSKLGQQQYGMPPNMASPLPSVEDPNDDGKEDDDDKGDDASADSTVTVILLLVACVVIILVFGYIVYRTHTKDKRSKVYRPWQQVNSNYRTL